MPVMDGFDATEKILKLVADNPSVVNSTGQGCNVVALTSYTDKKTVDRCFEYGMKDVIHKPLDANTLKRIVLRYHVGLTQIEYEKYIK